MDTKPTQSFLNDNISDLSSPNSDNDSNNVSEDKQLPNQIKKGWMPKWKRNTPKETELEPNTF